VKKAYNKRLQLNLTIILADLVMPVLDGFEMIRQLRKMPAFATLPILAVSASIFDYHQEQSLEVGCDAFIPKPFQAEIAGTITKKLEFRVEI
jgi:CheY-like chemotaxis protein